MVNIYTVVFLIMTLLTLCSLLCQVQCFGGKWCVHLQSRTPFITSIMKAMYSSEQMVANH